MADDFFLGGFGQGFSQGFRSSTDFLRARNERELGRRRLDLAERELGLGSRRLDLMERQIDAQKAADMRKLGIEEFEGIVKPLEELAKKNPQRANEFIDRLANIPAMQNPFVGIAGRLTSSGLAVDPQALIKKAKDRISLAVTPQDVASGEVAGAVAKEKETKAAAQKGELTVPAFPGQGVQQQSASTLLNLLQKTRQRQTLTPQEQDQYALAFAFLSKDEIFEDANGNKFTRPGINPQALGFPDPSQFARTPGINPNAPPVPGPQIGTGSRQPVQPPSAASGASPQTGTPASGPKSLGPGKAVSRDVLETLSQAQQAARALKDIEKGIGETGVIEGRISKGQAALGFNKKAIDFETARNNLKLAAQAMIKGIPSNFDVQTVIDTLPDLTQAESVNRSRAKFTRQSLKDLTEGTIGYYKTLGFAIPEFAEDFARGLGVDPAKVQPWDGKSDPFAKLIQRQTKPAQILKFDAQGNRIQ